MRFLLKIIVTSLAVFFASYVLRGVFLDGFPTAILVAIVLALLNAFLRPILIILTIPVTLITFGLFLLVINGITVLIADYAIGGFNVNNIGTAIVFSIIVSITSWLLEAIAGEKNTSKK